MKILLMTTHLNVGGISSYTISLAKRLRDAGHQVWVASSGGQLAGGLEADSLRHILVSLNTKSELNPKLLPAVFKLRYLIKRERIDIIHAQTRVAQVAAAFLSALCGVPYVTTCHGFFKPKKSRLLFQCWGAKVIAISEAVRAHLVNNMRVAKDKVELIYNGVDLKTFSCSYSREEKAGFREKFGLKKAPVVGIIARLSPVKGHRYFLEAAQKILKEKPDTQFLIIGDGPEEGNLKKLAQTLMIEERVRFFSSVFETGIPLSIIDVFVMPSLEEGLGLSILEAMACSVAVVASNVGGIYSLVDNGKSGYLVPPKNAEAIKEAVVKLLGDSGLRSKFAAAGRLSAEDKFSLDELSKRVERVYSETVEHKRKL